MRARRFADTWGPGYHHGAEDVHPVFAWFLEVGFAA
jgi:hypothetical protein